MALSSLAVKRFSCCCCCNTSGSNQRTSWSNILSVVVTHPEASKGQHGATFCSLVVAIVVVTHPEASKGQHGATFCSLVDAIVVVTHPEAIKGHHGATFCSLVVAIVDEEPTRLFELELCLPAGVCIDFHGIEVCYTHKYIYYKQVEWKKFGSIPMRSIKTVRLMGALRPSCWPTHGTFSSSSVVQEVCSSPMVA